MPSIFNKETAIQAGQLQDTGKLAELDQHELLKKEETEDQIASFNQIRELGKWYLDQKYNAVLPSSKSIPHHLLKSHELQGNQPFLGKLALGPDLESQFPVTIESIQTAQGRDLRLHIVPIHFGALEVTQFSQHTDSLLALAAAAAIAPQFILALEGGITTTQCSTKKDIVTSVTPDHGTPLAVTFDTFQQGTQTLNSAIAVTGNNDISIKQAAHLHGKSKPKTEHISTAASGSRIAAGVPIKTLLRSELPKHALFFSTTTEEITGQQRIISITESLLQHGMNSLELSFLAAALGFTSQVFGESDREKTIEKIFTPTNADIPLNEVIKSS